MNRVVLKYPLENMNMQTVMMPVGAKILTAQMQGETLCLWALVDRDTVQLENRQIQVVGTGHALDVDDAMQLAKYIATIQFYGGALVFHVFERFNHEQQMD